MSNIIEEVKSLFKSTDFAFVVCGGFALDLFAGRQLREHGDFDILVFEKDRYRLLQFLANKGWLSFGRFEDDIHIWHYLFYRVDNIKDNFWNDCKIFWVIKPDCLSNVLLRINRLKRHKPEVYTYNSREWLMQNELEYIELAFGKREGNVFVVRENPRVTRRMDKAVLHYGGISYLAPEVVLFNKSDRYSSEKSYLKHKTKASFEAIIPLLPRESQIWLSEAIDMAYPEGSPWLKGVFEKI